MPIYPYSFTLPPVNKQDIPSDGVAGEFLGINSGGQLDWLPVSGGSGSGDLLAANNLSELTPTAGTARTNLGLGTGDSPTFANLTLTSPSLSSSAPVTISQTWNAGSNVMTAFKVVATDTASGGTSSLLDAQTTAGGSQFSVRKGVVVGNNYSSSTTYGVKTASVSFGNYYGSGALCGSVNGLTLFAAPAVNAYISIEHVLATVGNTNSALAIGAAQDTILLRDAANTLALRNGANAQTFNVYGTYTSITDYKRLSLSCSATTGNATIAAPFNSVLAITGGSSNTSIAIVTFAAQAAAPPVGSTVVVAGVTPAGYNGTYTVTASTTTSVTYANTTNLPWGSGGTATLSNSGALTLTGAGYLGIGATSPIARLQVGTNGTGINIGAVFYNENPTIGNAVGFGFINESIGFNHFKASIVHERTASWARGKLHFLLNNSEGGAQPSLADARMTIQPDGNVGIGTTAPTAPLEIRGTAATGIREGLLKCTVSDSGNDAFHIYNATSADNRFSPGFSGSMFSSNVGSVIFTGQTDSTNDTGNSPLTVFSGRITSSQTDPNNGTLSAVTTRPLFAWWNLSTPVMQLNANGNLGIGTTSPTSKLQVSAGDVEVDTIAKGVILKSPDGTRYRVTVANGGTLSVAAV